LLKACGGLGRLGGLLKLWLVEKPSEGVPGSELVIRLLHRAKGAGRSVSCSGIDIEWIARTIGHRRTAGLVGQLNRKAAAGS
jgi:hypothetical protein